MINPLFLNIYACATQKKDPLLVTGYYLPYYFYHDKQGVKTTTSVSSVYLKEIYKYSHGDDDQGMKTIINTSIYLKEIYYYKYGDDNTGVITDTNINDIYVISNVRNATSNEQVVQQNIPAYLGYILVEQEFNFYETNIIEDLNLKTDTGITNFYLRDCEPTNTGYTKWKLSGT